MLALTSLFAAMARPVEAAAQQGASDADAPFRNVTPAKPPASRDAFMAGYRGAPVEAVTIAPSSIGMTEIGHMNYFRPQAVALWRETLDWLTAGTTAGHALAAQCR